MGGLGLYRGIERKSMKKFACVLALSLAILSGCQKEKEEIKLAEIIPADLKEVTLNTSGETVELDAENIEALMDVLKNIEMQEAEEKDASAPGSSALTLKLQGEEEVTITLPYLYYNGKAYCADKTCLEEFGKFFE